MSGTMLRDERENGVCQDTPGLPLPVVRRGKVRDVYELPPAQKGGTDRLLFVASDRISAFDVVLPTPILGKGKLLTQIATWWFRFIESRGLAETHLLSTNLDYSGGTSI